MIGEKIGFIPVNPKVFQNGARSRYLFDVSDALRKLDAHQSYSQMLIAWSAMKGARPCELNMTAMGWLRDGLDRENAALAAAGMQTLRIGEMTPGE